MKISKLAAAIAACLLTAPLMAAQQEPAPPAPMVRGTSGPQAGPGVTGHPQGDPRAMGGYPGGGPGMMGGYPGGGPGMMGGYPGGGPGSMGGYPGGGPGCLT